MAARIGPITVVVGVVLAAPVTLETVGSASALATDSAAGKTASVGNDPDTGTTGIVASATCRLRPARALTTDVDGHTITAKSKFNHDAEQILTKLPPIPA